MDQSAAVARTKVDDVAPPAAATDPALEQVYRAIGGLRFGEVRVIVQDGRIVQIERLEKHRLR